jgi:PAS domain S-box-containing protein
MHTPAPQGFPRADTLISTAREGIWVIDADARTTFASERMAEMLGCVPSEIIGKPAVQFFPDDAPDERLEALRQGHRRLSQCRFRRKDGSELWALVSTTPICDEQGNFRGALGMITDVTAQRKSEEEKSLVLDAMSDVLTYLDPEFRIRYMNRAAAACVRAVTEGPLGRYCYELRHGRSSACPDCPGLITLETRGRAEFETETPDGRLWHLRTFPVFGQEGGVVGIAEFARDVTETKKAAEALRGRDHRSCP